MTGIFSALGWIPGWLWAAICAAALATSCVTQNQLTNERGRHQATKTEHAERVAEAQRQRADEEAKRRKIEQELNDVVETQAREIADAQRTAALARSAAAAAAGQRVLDATQAAAQRARAQCAAASPASAREATGDPIGVLADVLGRADERAGILASLADERGRAGLACERLYDAARAALSASPESKE